MAPRKRGNLRMPASEAIPMPSILEAWVEIVAVSGSIPRTPEIAGRRGRLKQPPAGCGRKVWSVPTPNHRSVVEWNEVRIIWSD